MDSFATFAHLVAKDFQDIVKSPIVFVADIDGDALWEKYLASFPEGTDPIFRKRTWHDCSCCKQFIRRAGCVVTIAEDGTMHTVWDTASEDAPEFYKDIAHALRMAVLLSGIRDIFRVAKNESHFGAKQTHSLDEETKAALTWDHFYTGEIPARFRAALPDTDRGDYRTTVQVFERGLVELKPDAIDTVLSLIESNNLYRGEEHLRAVTGFQRLQHAFTKLSVVQSRKHFVWANASSPVARFRSTVIGTLVQDLSEGQDLETAVRSFEVKVAPQNYKRTTALITPMMVKKATDTISELGLESALERRYAVIGDISVNDVKWVDGAARPLMKGGIGEMLLQHVASTTTEAKGDENAEHISIGDFMTKVLPTAQGMEVFFSGAHLSNLMVLTAPVDPAPKQLFRWTNDYAWSYCGNVADSGIKERVKKAGGKVDGAALRVSLSWSNFDDLDLHIYQPTTRGVNSLQDRIFFNNRKGWTGGTLDVDMNAGSGKTREPVENVVWSTTPPDGPYKVVVNNYSLRESRDPGFVIEVESAGKLTHFSYNKGVRNQQDIHVATLHMKNGVIERVEAGDAGITSANISQQRWGLTTERYVKVNTVMLSPNYWGDNAVGNKHTFFVLEGAKSDEDMRGIYNEFLHPRLEPHRKVFEIIGDKTKCRPVEGHLSGLGFSSTKKDSFLVRVQQGKKKRVFNVHVGI